MLATNQGRALVHVTRHYSNASMPSLLPHGLDSITPACCLVDRGSASVVIACDEESKNDPKNAMKGTQIVICEGFAMLINLNNYKIGAVLGGCRGEMVEKFWSGK